MSFRPAPPFRAFKKKRLSQKNTAFEKSIHSEPNSKVSSRMLVCFPLFRSGQHGLLGRGGKWQISPRFALLRILTWPFLTCYQWTRSCRRQLQSPVYQAATRHLKVCVIMWVCGLIASLGVLIKHFKLNKQVAEGEAEEEDSSPWPHQVTSFSYFIYFFVLRMLIKTP